MSKNVHLIESDRFKKNVIKINFRRKTDRSEMTKLNFLTHLLLLSSKKYKTERDLLYRAKELYDLSESSTVNIFGKVSILSFTFSFLKDQYTEEGNTKNVFDFINEVMFNPNVKNKRFDKKTFEVAKNEIIDEIKTYEENKRGYSQLKMIEHMDPNSPAAIRTVGYLEDIDKITPKSLYEFYLEVFNSSTIDVFSLGDIQE